MFSRLFFYACIASSFVCSLSGRVFLYAPGVAPPVRVPYSWPIRQACTALRNLEVFSHYERLDVHIDEACRVARVADSAKANIVYIPLFTDYGRNVSVETGYLAQRQDIADVLYAFAYAAHQHEGPIHCIGHSRGAGTVATCMGLLWKDPEYLKQLITTYWSVPQSSVLSGEAALTNQLGHKLGVLCLMGTFDNLSETMNNIIDALALPRFLKQALTRDPRYVYDCITSILSLPYYNWDNTYTPRRVIQDIPADIPCVFLHTQHDAMNPVAVTEDLYAQRHQIAPQHTYVWMPDNSYVYRALRYVGGVVLTHIEYPQLHAVPVCDIGLYDAIAHREAHAL